MTVPIVMNGRVQLKSGLYVDDVRIPARTWIVIRGLQGDYDNVYKENYYLCELPGGREMCIAGFALVEDAFAEVFK